MPFQAQSFLFIALSWYEGSTTQEVIVQGVQQGSSPKGSLQRKHRYDAPYIIVLYSYFSHKGLISQCVYLQAPDF